MTVDTLGLVLRVLVTAANVGERSGGKQVLKRIKQSHQKISRLKTLWVDGGFDGEPFMQWVMNFCVGLCSWRCAQSKPRALSCSKNVGWLSAMHGWLMGCRRLVKANTAIFR